MRHWEITNLVLLCGGCGKQLEKRSPIQVIDFSGVKRKKFRGPCCATEVVPEEFYEPPTDKELLVSRVESLKSIGRRVVREYLPHPND